MEELTQHPSLMLYLGTLYLVSGWGAVMLYPGTLCLAVKVWL